MQMKYLPLTLAGVHALLAIVVFGSAIVSPERNGLAPILLFFTDFPVSLVLEWVRKALDHNLGYTARLITDCCVYTLGGSLWFYGIGVALRQAIQALR
jgi:hypothetical protein